ncbi:MAG: UDP-glucose/GDP-mannose dehydrogenase family protein [Synergistaceae bacterium]|nr:UDP-glucose/GDP-mannose dehydrogenase family protein [Synergistaceae bacterium]MBR0251518.1 UDP-glucose/GDP-mannose dehydrogenase family protein [Synergistaceae bacterium]
MNLVVIGTGYVGLVTGTCFARYGNNVTCVDVNAKRIETLNKGIVPFYEPGLEEMMTRNMKEGRLHFTRSTSEALNDAEICFICVGTPQSPDGSADLKYIESAAHDIGEGMKGDLLVVVKSTVPAGTNKLVEGIIRSELERRNENYNLFMASNPEFLREGSSLTDFLEPDRVIIGVNDSNAKDILSELYSFLEPSKLLFMDTVSAEMSKYAANAMLASRISFMNEIAGICEHVGADVESVRRGIGLDERIGKKFLKAGCGYGGSCFPKDVRALRDFARAAGYEPKILTAIDDVNERAKRSMFEKLESKFDSLQGKLIAIWGLSFKPKTSDTREAPSHVLIRSLIEAGASIHASDPRAIEETRNVIGEHKGLVYVQDIYDAVNNADALAIVTEWDIYKQPDFNRMKRLMNRTLIIDGRNLYSPDDMKRRGFEYLSVGRPEVFAE